MDNIRTIGTSALKLRPCDWNLWKVAEQEHYVAYALTAPGADCLLIVARVMHAVLDGRQVAMICEQADDAFSARFMAFLQELCTDGRRLKRGRSSAFIAVTDDLQENLLSASLLGAHAEGANPISALSASAKRCRLRSPSTRCSRRAAPMASRSSSTAPRT